MKKKFGQIILEEQWIREDELEKLLSLQKKLRKEGASVEETRIGKLMVLEGYIYPSYIKHVQKKQVAATQQIKKIGEIALEKKIITEDELDELLLRQQSLRQQGHEKKETLLGKLMLELYISQSHLNLLLMEQVGEFEDYEIHSEIGRGGMGIVYKVFNNKLKRYEALKFVSMNEGSKVAKRRDFVREAMAMAAVNHPNIARIYSAEKTPTAYISMEYINGYLLNDRNFLATLDFNLLARLFYKVSLAIAFMHEQGIIHRDIKPSNIMIDKKTFEPKVMDFGIARIVDVSQSAEQTRSQKGTLLYMSPQQLKSENVGFSTDIYSLGVTLYECLVGYPPFIGKEFEIQNQILHQIPKPPRSLNTSIPIELEAICLKAMEKNIHHRYASAEAFACDLQNYLEDKPVIAKKWTVYRSMLFFYKRNYAFMNIAFAFLLILISILVFYIKNIQYEKNIAKKIQVEKAQEARANSILLAKIALEKAYQESQNKNWRLCGSFAGKSTKFIRNLQGNDISDLRYKAKKWLMLSVLRHQLRWSNQQHSDVIRSIHFSNDDQFIVSGSWDGHAKIFDATTGREVCSLKYEDRITKVIFDHKNNNIVYCGTNKGTILIWNWAQNEITTHQVHDKAITDIDFVGQFVATASRDFSVKIWDSKFKCLNTTNFSSICRNICSTKKHLVICTNDGDVYFWDLQIGDVTKYFSHKSIVYSLDTSPDKNLIISCSDDTDIKIWNTQTSSLQTLNLSVRGVTCVVFHPHNSNIIAFSDWDGKIQVWNILHNEKIATFTHDSTVFNICFSKNGEYIASCSYDGDVKLWTVHRPLAYDELKDISFVSFTKNYFSFTEKKRIHVFNRKDTQKRKTVSGYRNFAICDDKNILVTTSKRNICVVDLQTMTNIHCIPSPKKKALDIVFSRDTNYVALRFSKQLTAIYDVKTMKMHKKIVEQGITSVVFHPQQDVLIYNTKNQVRFYDFIENTLYEKKLVHDTPIKAMCVSKKLPLLGVATLTHIYIWNFVTFKMLVKWKAHSQVIHTIDFHPEQNIIASAGLSKNLKVWQISQNKAKLVANLQGHQSQITKLSFHPNGKLIASVSFDESLFIWDLDKKVVTIPEANCPQIKNFTSLASLPEWSRNITKTMKSSVEKNNARFYRFDIPAAWFNDILFAQSGELMAKCLFEIDVKDNLSHFPISLKEIEHQIPKK